MWARVRIHGGLRSIGVSLLRTSRRSSLRPSGAIVTPARLRGEISPTRSESMNSSLGHVDLRIFTEPQQGASYDDLLRVAQTAEDAGFDAFFRSDHFLAMGGRASPGPTDSYVTLAGLARETSRIRLGTLVTSATFRLPGPLAVAVAQVDQMSRRARRAGAGRGLVRGRAHGVRHPVPGAAPSASTGSTEQLEIVTGLWARRRGSGTRSPGRIPVVDSPALPKPVQRPHPPVIVGGTGARAHSAARRAVRRRVQRAVRPVEEVAAQFARVDQACADAGRDPAELARSVAQRSAWAATTPRWRDGRRRSAVTVDDAQLDVVGTRGAGRRPVRQVAERPASRASTCSCSTWPTWSTSS